MNLSIAKASIAVVLTLCCLLPLAAQAQLGARNESVDRQEALRAHRAEDRRAEQRLQRLRQKLEASPAHSAEIDAARKALAEAQTRLSEARAAVEAASADLYLAAGLAESAEAEAQTAGSAAASAAAAASTDCTAGQAGCPSAALAEALRWEGLNLAQVDARLGHYFGTDRGVLVLLGARMPHGLQPGDVIQHLDGQAVATPREAMRVLRSFGPGDKVVAQLIREHQPQRVELVVPERVDQPVAATASAGEASL